MPRESEQSWRQQLPAVVLAIVIMWVLTQLMGCTVDTGASISVSSTPAAEATATPPEPTVPPMPPVAPPQDNLVVPVVVPVTADATTPPPSAGESKTIGNAQKPAAQMDEPIVAPNAQEPHPRAGQHKQVLIQQSRHVWGLRAPVSSFAAQIHQESRWNPNARSPVGAAGLTQFMPATAAWIGTYDRDLAVVDVYNPRWAMRALVVYNKFLYDKVAGKNPCERMAFALSAYNGGLGWVNKRKARSSTPDVCFGATCEINPGIAPANQRENANYPKLILKQFEPLYVRSGWGSGVCH